MKTAITRLLTISALMFAMSHSYAADLTPSAAAAPDRLAAARTQIAAKNWPAAIDELRRVNDTRDADWNNLMGYSLRKAGAANAAESERYYNEALRIDPKHKGALEYSGELYLMMGDLPKAEQRLTALDKACFLPCSEYKDLKNAVAKYKANGNKYVGDW
jgi:Flp pilus assembly protein TadD